MFTCFTNVYTYILHLLMFIHETIYTINVRKIKMESFFSIDMLVEESTHA